MPSLLDNMFSCETTKFINQEFKYSLRADSLLPAKNTRFFSDIYFLKVDKSVYEYPTEVRISITGIIKFCVHMPSLDFYIRNRGDAMLKNTMRFELKDIHEQTIQNVYKVVNQICERAYFCYGRINKKIIVVPNITVQTDGQYI